MKEILYNIVDGTLYTDLDTPYDKSKNKIDVYCSVYWTGETEDEYTIKQKIIFDYTFETDLFKMVSWCDVSGFDYWVKRQEETNYVSIDVYLKKPVEEYTQEEMMLISKAIIVADEYFMDKLGNTEYIN